MSWSIKSIGCRCAVRQQIEKETNLPAPVKDLILSTLSVIGEEDALVDADTKGVRVEGYGHQFTGPGSSFSCIGKLEIEPLQLVNTDPGDQPAEINPGPGGMQTPLTTEPPPATVAPS